MADLFPLYKTGPQLQSLRFRFEKAGVILEEQPIPWGADAVLVEANLFLPPTLPSRTPADFPLLLDDEPPQLPESVTPLARGGLKLLYRLSVPRRPATAEVYYRQRSLGQLALPVLSAAEFSRRLVIEMPTLAVSLGDRTVTCQAFVGSQCHGLIASAVLKSPNSCLLPLFDLGMSVHLAGPRGESRVFPLAFSSAQLIGKQTLVSALLPRPRRLGEWRLTWRLGDTTLAHQTFRALSKPQFFRSLKLGAARFLVVRDDNAVSILPGLPSASDDVRRVGPCFIVQSHIPGVADLIALRVVARVGGAVQPPLLEEDDFLISDGPNPIVPGTIAIDDLDNVETFEIHTSRGLLGKLPLRIPTATIDAEGGFAAAEDFSWSDAAEEELKQKLAGLTTKKG